MIRLNQGAVNASLTPTLQVRGVYDFLAEHSKHLRTSNPVESTFATARHRTVRSKGYLSNKTGLAMIFEGIKEQAQTAA